MVLKKATKGFSLIELLLVLAILGILGSIAVPLFLGQRTRAKLIGDAKSNTSVLQMQLESRKSENGIYGAEGTYQWKADKSATTGPALLPAFQPGGTMDYSLTITQKGLLYSVAVIDAKSSNRKMYEVDQSGKVIYEYK